MLNPEESTPLNEDTENDPEDQQSQQDVHSDGFDDVEPAESNEPDTEGVQAAYDASESAFTLNLDRGIAPELKKDKEDTNIKE